MPMTSKILFYLIITTMLIYGCVFAATYIDGQPTGGGGGSGGTNQWGQISGTLSNQADLWMQITNLQYSKSDKIIVNGVTNSVTNGIVNLGAITSTGTGITWTNAPVATNSPGVPGMWAQDTNHLYLCVGSNLWRRVILGSW
jgi:hypothetical protein